MAVPADALPTHSAAAAQPAHAAGPGSAWLVDPQTLLLVEDDPGDMILVEELLTDSGVGATLSWARSMAEATQLLRAEGMPGCVLLDLHLPDAQGIEAVTQLLAVAPAAPVVVLTGLTQESAGLAAVAAGAQDFLIKGQAAPGAFARAIRYAAQRKHVEQASAALQLSALRAEENARLERGLLPTPLLRTGTVQVVTRYLPGRAQALVGGDFYDVVETADGTVHAVIGDVAGHGAAEAAIGVCLRVAWRSLVLAGTSPPELMELLEQILVAEREGEQLFATLTHLALAPDRSHAGILRAGHPGMLLRAGADVELIERAGGPALGLLPGFGWKLDEMQLPQSGTIVLFTDGLFEGRIGPGPERLGEYGLLEVARGLSGLAAGPFADGLIERAEAAAADYGGLADDIAIVQLAWTAPR